MVQIKPKPKKKAFLSVAVTFEVRDGMKEKAKSLDISVSELMFQLAEKFLAGEFDGIEDIKPRRKSSVKSKREKELA